MAKTYNIALYKISITPWGDPSKPVVLSDFCKGKDLQAIIYDMLASLCYVQDVPIDTDDKKEDETKTDTAEKKYFRIMKNDNQDVLKQVGRSVSGIIESGEFGTEENIVNVKTGESRKKLVDEALLVPFYFMIQVPEHSSVAFLLIERISNIGIFSILEKKIKKAVEEALGTESDNFVVNISPLAIKKVMEKHVALLGGAKKITLERINSRDLSVSKATNGEISDEEIGNTQIVYTAKRNKMLSIINLFNKYKDRKESDVYSVGEVEYKDIKFEVEVGGHLRSLSMQDVSKLGTYIEITNDLRYDSTQYPTFSSLHKAALGIYDDIIKEINKHESSE